MDRDPFNGGPLKVGRGPDLKEIYGYATGRFRAYKVLCFNFSISRRILNVLNRKDDVALRWSKL